MIRVEEFLFRTRIPFSSEEVFRWHERPGAFQRLNPPWESVKTLSSDGGIRNGSRVEILARWGMISQRWMLEHQDYQEGRQFRDVQIKGPFAHWNHLHRIDDDGANACYLEDRIDYSLPGGVIGRSLASRFVRHKLERMFRYRHAVTAADMAAHAQFSDKGFLRILISGSTGLLGSALVPFLQTGGHRVVRLVRKPNHGEDSVFWDPVDGIVDVSLLEGFDAFIHLSGEYIANGRWDKHKRDRVWSSRVRSTEFLVNSIKSLKNPPKVLVCASGTGFYGEGADKELDENSPSGAGGFFVDLVRQWEAAAKKAEIAGVRVVHTRIGVVLTPAGGALKSMLPAFRWGAGAVLGSGKEFTAWLTLDDLIGMMHFVLMQDNICGPVNFSAPKPVTQQELAEGIGRVLKRPVLFKIPNTAIRWMFSPELAEAMGWSQRVIPKRLLECGYAYRYPELEGALGHVLGIA